MAIRKHKFKNVPTEVDGIKFHSKKEAIRYSELKLLMLGGVVKDLCLQVSHELVVSGQSVCRYIADFVYQEKCDKTGTWTTVVEDTKGFKTPEYKLKKKLMKAIYDIDIRET